MQQKPATRRSDYRRVAQQLELLHSEAAPRTRIGDHVFPETPPGSSHVRSPTSPISKEGVNGKHFVLAAVPRTAEHKRCSKANSHPFSPFLFAKFAFKLDRSIQSLSKSSAHPVQRQVTLRSGHRFQHTPGGACYFYCHGDFCSLLQSCFRKHHQHRVYRGRSPTNCDNKRSNVAI